MLSFLADANLQNKYYCALCTNRSVYNKNYQNTKTVSHKSSTDKFMAKPPADLSTQNASSSMCTMDVSISAPPPPAHLGIRDIHIGTETSPGIIMNHIIIENIIHRRTYRVSLLQQKLCQIRSILASNSSD